MSNWLGFSLTPHMRIDEEFGTENQNHVAEGSEIGRNYVTPSSHPHPHHLSIMPLRSDGSLCVSDSFTPQGIYMYFLFLLISNIFLMVLHVLVAFFCSYLLVLKRVFFILLKTICMLLKKCFFFILLI